MRRLVMCSLAVLVLSLLAAGPAGAWTWPLRGAVLRPFVLGSNPYAGGQHRGIDVAGASGEPILAPVAGIVTFAGTVPTHGRVVTIRTGDGLSVTLSHLGVVLTTRGALVGEGEAVGAAGASGSSEHAVPYVQLGVRVTADEHGYVDPELLLPPRVVATAPPAPSAPIPEPSASPTGAAGVERPGAGGSPGVSASAGVAPSADPVVAPSSTPAAPSAETPATGAAATAVVTHAAVGARHAAGAPAGLSGAPDPGGSSSRPPTPAFPPKEADGTAMASAVRETVARPASSGSPPGVARRRGRDPRPAASAATPAVDPAVAGAVRAPGRGGERAVEVVVSGAVARHARDGSAAHVLHGVSPTDVGVRGGASSSAERVGGGLPVAVAAGVALLGAALLVWIVLAAGEARRRAGRRIGPHGALLRHDADLLRQLDTAHRSRLHDDRGGRLRAAPASARA